MFEPYSYRLACNTLDKAFRNVARPMRATTPNQKSIAYLLPTICNVESSKRAIKKAMAAVGSVKLTPVEVNGVGEGIGISILKDFRKLIHGEVGYAGTAAKSPQSINTLSKREQVSTSCFWSLECLLAQPL